MTLFDKDGEKLAIPDPAPTRDGYRLAGWTTDEARQTDYTADASVTHDLTLYAKWVKTWTVTFDTQDGTPVTTQIVDDNSHATVPNPAPARDEYKLTGWSTDATGGTAYDFNATPVTGDVTLYAEWTRTSHQWTIKFDLNGGAAPEGKEATKLYADQKVYDGDPLISPTVDQTNVPVLEGYEFQGWSTVRNDALAKSVLWFDENGKSLMPIDRDGTVYALWAKMGTVVKPPTSTSDSTTNRRSARIPIPKPDSTDWPCSKRWSVSQASSRTPISGQSPRIHSLGLTESADSPYTLASRTIRPRRQRAYGRCVRPYICAHSCLSIALLGIAPIAFFVPIETNGYPPAVRGAWDGCPFAERFWSA